MANNPNPARTRLGLAFAAALVLAWSTTSLVGQASAATGGPRRTIFVGAPPAGLHIDGDLGEWSDGPARTLVKIDRLDQIWHHAKRRKWGGPADLSADLKIAQDANHIYLAGTIRDDHHVPVREGENLETGDSIEIFLNVKLAGDGEDASASHRLGKEDVQLFLLPLAGKWFRRPWDRDNPADRKSVV